MVNNASTFDKLQPPPPPRPHPETCKSKAEKNSLSLTACLGLLTHSRWMASHLVYPNKAILLPLWSSTKSVSMTRIIAMYVRNKNLCDLRKYEPEKICILPKSRGKKTQSDLQVCCLSKQQQQVKLFTSSHLQHCLFSIITPVAICSLVQQGTKLLYSIGT